MKTKKHSVKNLAFAGCVATLVAVGMTASHSTHAMDQSWSVGANVGEAKSKWDNKDISSAALDSAFTGDTTASDDKSTSYKLFFGYQFTPFFSIETGYFDLGKSTFTMNTLPTGKLYNQTKVQGFNIDAVGSLPITDMFSVFARFGANYAETKVSFSGAGLMGVDESHDSNRDTNYKFGAGAQLNLTNNLGVRLEAESYRLTNPQDNDDSIDVASLGLVYRFAQ